jgi:DNA repair exonuclease SbcCD ATPase subunit
MLAPVSNVSNASAVQPINVGTPVATDDAQRLQLERQVQDYNTQLDIANRQLADAQDEARRAAAVQDAQQRVEQLQQQAAAAQQRLDRLNAENNQQDLREEQLQADRVQADRVRQERLAENQAADQLAADRLTTSQNAIAPEPQIRPPVTNAVETTATGNGLQPSNPEPNTEVIPPLAPDNSGRLVNTQV